jgi:small-conductance mechanosensitive channel
LADIVSSIKRLVAFLVGIMILAVTTVALFVLFIAKPINLPTLATQIVGVVFALSFGIAAMLLLNRIKPILTPRIGFQLATVIQYASIAFAFVVLSFWIIWILGVTAPQDLLTSAGIVSITIGLIISTFVGSILSGALVFTTYRFKIGDHVIVNNIPGTIRDMTAIVMRIRTDNGHISIPNSAIASGTVIVTAVHQHHVEEESRLPYSQGDRVITTFMNEQGIVKELTPYHTIILTDSGKEIKFQNSTVLMGTVAVAKICQPKTRQIEVPTTY